MRRPQKRLKRYKKHNSIYIDVDGTLIKSGRPNTSLIKAIKDWHSKGYYLVLWSAAGEKHARDVSERLMISELFNAILTKPEIIYDDLGNGWNKYIAIHKV